MGADLLKTMGQIAGIGGLALGAFLLLFRDVIRKRVFPQLTKRDAYRLLRLVAILVFSISALGVLAGIWAGTEGPVVAGDRIDADCSTVNTGSISGSSINTDCPNGDPSK